MDFSLAGRMLGALAVIAIVLFSLQIMVRTNLRQQISGGDRRLISVLETTLLPNAASLHVVKIAERYVVIGRSGGHIAMLSDIPQAGIDAWFAAQPPNGSAATRFAQLITRIRTGGSA
jgi:flagellar biogenesis protein FliO